MPGAWRLGRSRLQVKDEKASEAEPGRTWRLSPLMSSCRKQEEKAETVSLDSVHRNPTLTATWRGGMAAAGLRRGLGGRRGRKRRVSERRRFSRGSGRPALRRLS